MIFYCNVCPESVSIADDIAVLVALFYRFINDFLYICPIIPFNFVVLNLFSVSISKVGTYIFYIINLII